MLSQVDKLLKTMQKLETENAESENSLKQKLEDHKLCYNLGVNNLP